jgi:hypothetical protein
MKNIERLETESCKAQKEKENTDKKKQEEIDKLVREAKSKDEASTKLKLE